MTGSGGESSREVRKKVTAVFADMAGSTTLAENLDPELFRQVVRAFFERMEGAIKRHGGTVENFIGDEVMGIFGAPVSHGDDALRAVRAAAEMLTEVEELNTEIAARVGSTLGLRIGVNTGTVIVGPPIAGRSMSLGDTMNVAARLEKLAEPGQILIGEDTYRLVRGEVEVEPAGHRRASRPHRAARDIPPARRGARRRRAAGRPADGGARARSRLAPGRLRAQCRASFVRVRDGARRSRRRQVPAGGRDGPALPLQRDRARRPLPVLRRGDHLLAADRDRLAGRRSRGFGRRRHRPREAERRACGRRRGSRDRQAPGADHRARRLVRTGRAGVLGRAAAPGGAGAPPAR